MQWTLRRLSYRIGERFWDWRFGLKTYCWVPPTALGPGKENCGYEPCPFPLLLRLMRAIPPEFHGRGFLDYGCGLGRVLFVAQRLGYDPVVGVEISETLSARARANLRGTGAGVITGDAASYAIPAFVRIFFFFNPFAGAALETVIRNIEAHAASCGDSCLVVGVTLRNLGPLLEKRQCFQTMMRGPGTGAWTGPCIGSLRSLGPRAGNLDPFPGIPRLAQLPEANAGDHGHSTPPDPHWPKTWSSPGGTEGSAIFAGTLGGLIRQARRCDVVLIDSSPDLVSGSAQCYLVACCNSRAIIAGAFEPSSFLPLAIIIRLWKKAIDVMWVSK